MMRSVSFLSLALLSSLIPCPTFGSNVAPLPRSPIFASDPAAPFPNPNLNSTFRPPAVPLVLLSPTISVWSMSDNLTDDYSRHWDNDINDFRGMINIDGSVYRWWGPEGLCGTPAERVSKTKAKVAESDPPKPGCSAPAIPQLAVSVQPTQTFYTFATSSVQLRVAFTTPAFPHDLKSMAKPWTYISFTVTPLDSQNHTVSVYLDHTAEVTVQDTGLNVWWSDVSRKFSPGLKNIHALKMGSYLQIPFNRFGDYERNDWGYSYFLTQSARATSTVSDSVSARRSFTLKTPLPAFDTRVPRGANDAWPVAVLNWDLGTISAATSEFAVFAYDDDYSMDYFHDYQRPYWYHLYDHDVFAMLQDALLSYPQLVADSNDYDAKLITELAAVSSTLSYPTLCSLVHRQTTGASVVVWNEDRQEPWVYLKEISSDGDISTVDVVYPAAPFFLERSPEMMRRMLLPLMAYANNETDVPYRLPWAPHHLGTWPVAFLDAEEQEQMPVEESANMLILFAAVAQKENFDVDYLAPYWGLLEQWNGFLAANLPDPDNQLCTDDFEGPSPHNVNLAIKGTLGMAAYSLLLKYKGDTAGAATVLAQAQSFADQIVTNAATDSKDHLRMQFDLPNSWSQKYNLVWQYILDVPLYNDSIANTELTYYLKQASTYGFALDSRNSYTKGDWSSWSAATGRDSKQGDAVFDYIYRWADEDQDRVPFSDWYDTVTPKMQGFKARPVMGGMYARLLDVESRKQRQREQSAKVVQM